MKLRKLLYTAAAVVALVAQPFYAVVAGQAAGAEAPTGVTNVTSAVTYGDLQSAVDAASGGDVLQVNENLVLDSDVDIDKPLTIDGNYKSISAGPAFVKTGNDNNSLLSVLDNDVTIKNVTLDGVDPVAKELHGINAYQAERLHVEFVLAMNFRTGILYNGSTGTIRFVTTRDNLWHGVNIDKPGANVVISGVNFHEERLQVYVDDMAGVTVDAPAYDYSHPGEQGRPNDRVYQLRVPTAEFTSPVDGYVSTGPVDVRATMKGATVGHYWLTVQASDGIGYIAEPLTEDIVDGVIYTLTEAGEYVLTLMACSAGLEHIGTCSDEQTLHVTVKAAEQTGPVTPEIPVRGAVVDPRDETPATSPDESDAPVVAWSGVSTAPASTAPQEDVLGTSTERDETTDDTKEESTDKAEDKGGIAWYWWPVMVIVLAGVWWAVAAIRRRGDA